MRDVILPFVAAGCAKLIIDCIIGCGKAAREVKWKSNGERIGMWCLWIGTNRLWSFFFFCHQRSQPQHTWNVPRVLSMPLLIVCIEVNATSCTAALCIHRKSRLLKNQFNGPLKFITTTRQHDENCVAVNERREKEAALNWMAKDKCTLWLFRLPWPKATTANASGLTNCQSLSRRCAQPFKWHLAISRTDPVGMLTAKMVAMGNTQLFKSSTYFIVVWHLKSEKLILQNPNEK